MQAVFVGGGRHRLYLWDDHPRRGDGVPVPQGGGPRNSTSGCSSDLPPA